MSTFKGMALVFALSANVIAAQFTSCRFNSANELLSAIKKNHPDILYRMENIEVQKWSISNARKRINPTIELEHIKSSSGPKTSGSSIKLLQRFELGGKSSARVEVARKEADLLRATSKMDNNDTIISIVTKMYELRQNYDLVPLYVESLSAFKRILRSLKKRSSLSALQQVELETLDLVIGDYSFKLSELEVKIGFLEKHLFFYAGNDCKIQKSSLPNSFEKSRDQLGKLNLNSFNKVIFANSYVDLKNAEVEYEKSMAYSDFEIGPVVELSTENGVDSRSIGLSVGFEIPIFNRNHALKQKSRHSLRLAKKVRGRVLDEVSLDFSSWKQQYERYTSSLSLMPNKLDLHRKHKKIEALFKRGIISTSMVIESHRQLIEYSTTRNLFEVGAVTSLWNTFKYSGDLFKRNLK